MRIGWNGGGHHRSLDTIRADARRAAEAGFSSFWLAQITGPDALTAFAAIAADAPGILVAALGPKMLDLAGREADGTTLWMVGPQTIASHIAPRIREAADAAGRSEPRILAGVPVCATDAVDRARAHAAASLEMYGRLPAYRAMLDREGIGGPEHLLAVGSEDAVREQLAGFEGAGATDLRVAPLTPTEEETERTRALLAAIAKENAGTGPA